MSAVTDKDQLVAHWQSRCIELLHLRHQLSRDDLEYLVARAATLKDTRLQSCIAELIGYSDDDRSELETFVAIALELMKTATPSRLRDAARIVEIRTLLKDSTGN